MTGETLSYKDAGEQFVRFAVRQRIEHVALIVTFTTLAVTGLIQRFYTVSVAEWAILNLGGIETVRDIHRVFGAIFALGFIYHLVFLTYNLLVRHARQSMLPSRKDFTDIVDSLKYALGTSETGPQFGRYNYRQKFEYWGLVFGSLIITATGIVMVYPILFTKVLPGQVVAAAITVHGWEATLAVLTIIVWHLYEVVLRPDVFPVDTSIFTGKLSKERMIEEHPLEYARLTESADRTVAEPANASALSDPQSDPVER